MPKFVQRHQSQLYLLPPDLRDWLPEDDLAHFVVEAVERVPLERFQVNERGTGSAQYHPRMILALLVYCYANGIFGWRRIERATYRDIGVRYVAANCHPDHDTICTFRRSNFEAVAEAFLQVLLLAEVHGLSRREPCLPRTRRGQLSPRLAPLNLARRGMSGDDHATTPPAPARVSTCVRRTVSNFSSLSAASQRAAPALGGAAGTE